MDEFRPLKKKPSKDGDFVPMAPRNLGSAGVPRPAAGGNRPQAPAGHQDPAPPPHAEDTVAPPPVSDLAAELEAAYTRGQADAVAALEAERKELLALAEHLAGVIDQAATVRREALDHAASDIAQLVAGLTRRALGVTLQLKPEALIAIVQDAITRMPDQEEVWVEVAPEWIDMLREAITELNPESIRPVPGLKGAKIRNRFACIDATIDAATAGIETALQQWTDER
ncbi:MAG: FliH/SctL family protein [Myxococcota bacterium]